MKISLSRVLSRSLRLVAGAFMAGGVACAHRSDDGPPAADAGPSGDVVVSAAAASQTFPFGSVSRNLDFLYRQHRDLIGDFTEYVRTPETDTSLVLRPDGSGGVEWAAGGGGSPADGAYADITVSGGGASWVIGAGKVTPSKLADADFGAFTVSSGVAALDAGSVGASALASTAVTPGAYAPLAGTVDADGRLTSAAVASSAAIQSALGSVYLPLGGGTLSGDLNFAGNDATNLASVLFDANDTPATPPADHYSFAVIGGGTPVVKTPDGITYQLVRTVSGLIQVDVLDPNAAPDGSVLQIVTGNPVWAAPAEATNVADADYGDVAVSSGVWSLDSGVVQPATLADADFGSFSISAGVASMDAGSVGASALADGDYGDVSVATGVVSLDGGVVRLPTLSQSLYTQSGAAPTVNDDSADGYEIGSLWWDNIGSDLYVATEVVLGAAVWTQINGGGNPPDGDYGDVVIGSGVWTLDTIDHDLTLADASTSAAYRTITLTDDSAAAGVNFGSIQFSETTSGAGASIYGIQTANGAGSLIMSVPSEGVSITLDGQTSGVYLSGPTYTADLSNYDHHVVVPTGNGKLTPSAMHLSESTGYVVTGVAATDVITAVGHQFRHITFTGASVTGDAGTDIITVTNHGLVSGDTIFFSSVTGGSGISTGYPYYVIVLSANTFSISALHSAGVLNFTTNITAATFETPRPTVAFANLVGGANLANFTVYYVRDVVGDTFKVSLTSSGAVRDFTTDITSGVVALSYVQIRAQAEATSPSVALPGAPIDYSVAQDLVLSPGQYRALYVSNRPADGYTYSGVSISSFSGNPRGSWSVDLQANRSANTQVASGTASFIGGGSGNTASGQNAVVCGGGEYNQLRGNVASGTQSFVGAGNRNTASANWSVAVGGVLNTASGSYSAVGGGDTNAASGSHSVIAGGEDHNVASTCGSVLGGWDNDIATGGDFASIIGGTFNDVTLSGDFSTILNGQLNIADLPNSIVSGVYGDTDHTGSAVFSPTRKATTGDSQTSIVPMLGVSTTDATPTLLTIEGASHITVASGVTYALEIRVVGRSTGGESAAYFFTALIENNGGTTTLIGGGTPDKVIEDDATWDCAVTASDASDRLEITVTGEAATTIRWSATVETTKAQ